MIKLEKNIYNPNTLIVLDGVESFLSDEDEEFICSLCQRRFETQGIHL